jgi:general secretion pathway protein D
MNEKNASLKPRTRSLSYLCAITLLTGSLTAFAQPIDDEDMPLPPPPSLPPGAPQPVTNSYNPPAMGKNPPTVTRSLAPSRPIPMPATTSRNANGATPAATVPEPNTVKSRFATAGIEDITDENFPDLIESFDFPNAEITDVVNVISELTGKNFILDNNVHGKITIIAPSKITVAEAYKTFLSALAINGLAVVPSGKFLKIRQARKAQKDGIETYSGAYYPSADQMITRIIHLKHISADTVNQFLRNLNSSEGEIFPYPPTNSIIISDYGSNIDRVMKILAQLDIPGFDDQMEVVQIRYAKAKDIADLINKIVNKGDTKAQPQGGFSAGVPRFNRSTTTNGQSGSAYFLVFPEDRTNSLIVLGNKSGIERVRKLVSQLDFRIRPDENGGVHVYYLKYGDAVSIATTLTGIAKDAGVKPATSTATPSISPTSGVQAPTEIFGGDVKITADKGTNSLVIVASKSDYDMVLNLLNQLDIPADQVYVEAIIMEMNSNDTTDWKVGFFQYDQGGSGLHSGFNGGDSSTLANLLSPVGGTGAILGFGSGGNVQIQPNSLAGGTSTSTAITLPSLVSFVNFLKTNANGNVLSTPGVLALNNQEATISVGDQVITSTNSTTTSTGVTQVTPVLQDATIDLKIKPFISPSSSKIRMDIDSQIKQLSSVPAPQAFQSTTTPLAKRAIKTSIVVPDGDTAVLGGLMKDNDKVSVTKVPLLGDIPIIGWLFKSQSVLKEKQNLVVFLTPKILRGPEQSKQLLNKKVDQRLGFIKSMGGRDPYGEKIDEIMGVTATKDAEKRTK